MILKNANVFLSDENAFKKADIKIENGKIISIENNINDNDIEIINCDEKYLMPGFIDAHTHIGLYEIAHRWELDNTNEITENSRPTIKAIDGFCPNNTELQSALEGGVTTVCTGPGSTNVLGGIYAIMSTYGNTVEECTINPHYAMKCAFGENTKQQYGQIRNVTPITRMGVAEVLRRALFDTVVYKDKKEFYKSKNIFFEINFYYESLIPVIEKKIPLKAHAHRADDIMTSIRIAKEFDVRITLDHCTEGHLIAGHIKKENLSVINGPTFMSKSKYEIDNKSFSTAKVLYEHDILFAIMTDHPCIVQENINIAAMLACKAGLPEIEALKAITINAAKILEIDSFKGKIALGYDADLVLWSEHPLSIMAKPEIVAVKGKIVKNKN